MGGSWGGAAPQPGGLVAPGATPRPGVLLTGRSRALGLAPRRLSDAPANALHHREDAQVLAESELRDGCPGLGTPPLWATRRTGHQHGDAAGGSCSRLLSFLHRVLRGEGNA